MSLPEKPFSVLIVTEGGFWIIMSGEFENLKMWGFENVLIWECANLKMLESANVRMLKYEPICSSLLIVNYELCIVNYELSFELCIINCQLLIVNWMSHDMSSNVLIVSVSLLKTSLISSFH